jgi:ABC-type phosphate transport system auxiliary subunit
MDLIFNLCAASAMVSMTAAVVAISLIAIYGVWRLLSG